MFFIVFFIFNSELIKAGALDGLVKYGNDSSYYIDSANKLVDWDFSNIDFSKLSYVLLIAIVLFLNLNLATVVILQFISTIIASYCLYLIGKKIYSRWAGLLCLGLFLSYFPIQLRNFYILTEILFINFSIILVCLVFLYKEKKILISLTIIFILFLRPQSPIILLSILYPMFLFSKFNINYNFLLKFFVIFFFLIIFLTFLNIGINDYNLIESLSRGIIWGYSFETKSICLKNCIPGLTNPDIYEKNIYGLFLYVKDNLVVLTKVSIYKIIIYFTGWRPYYSGLHNLYILFFHIPIYILFCLHFLKFKKYDRLEIFSISYILLSALFVGVTFADWSGRYVMYILPFVMIYASVSFANLLNKLLFKFSIKK